MRLLSTAFIGLSIARASVASAQPISIGFELEDSSIEYSTVKPPAENCRNHRAKLNQGAYVNTTAVGMVVGADSHGGDYCDLEIRSQPMLLGDDKKIDDFFAAYGAVYEAPLANVEGVQKRTGFNAFAIVPQLTVSIPIARLGDLADIGLFATDYEVNAVRAFNHILAAVDHTGLAGNTTQVQLVDGVGRFIAMYLAGAWPQVTRSLLPVAQKRYEHDGRAITGSKAHHSLFLKAVERDGSKRNGVVDLYSVLRKEFPGKEVELHKILESLLDQTLTQLGNGNLKPDDVTALKAFTNGYLAYLADEATRIVQERDQYQPNPFIPTAQVRTTAGMRNLYFADLEAIDTTIQPLSGQERSVYVEERRLGNTPRQNVTSNQDIAVAIASLKSPGSDDSSEKHANHATDVLRQMVRFYQRFFVVELNAKPADPNSDNNDTPPKE